MINWYQDKQEIIQKTINAIYDEISCVIEPECYSTANYWLDNCHNVFAERCYSNDECDYIEIHYELYDCKEDLIGDIDVLLTEDLSRESLLKCITDIVNEYYG